tara:strand:+ start:1610 stop:1795 length:186 start_codon:yes stop_codon:yes gene_type:complete
MNTNFKIQRAFNTHKESTLDNVYVPKVKSTVNVTPSSFNEIAENIREQLKPKSIKQLEIWS